MGLWYPRCAVDTLFLMLPAANKPACSFIHTNFLAFSMHYTILKSIPI